MARLARILGVNYSPDTFRVSVKLNDGGPWIDIDDSPIQPLLASILRGAIRKVIEECNASMKATGVRVYPKKNEGGRG